MEEGVGKEKE
jgi:hypothetical protein